MKSSRRTMTGSCVAWLFLLLVWSWPVAAQETWRVSREASASDVNSIDAIIAAFYDVVSGPAGQPRDWTRDSTLYLPGARFTIAGDGPNATVRTVDHATFARESGPGLERGFFETEIHRVTRAFGPMMNVFSTYEWRTTADGPVGGRGINSIQLFHDGTRWWIASAMWASETPDRPIPAEFLPRAGR